MFSCAGTSFGKHSFNRFDLYAKLHKFSVESVVKGGFVFFGHFDDSFLYDV